MSTRYLLIVIVASVALCGMGAVAAQVPTLPPDGGSRLDTPSCSTFDREKQAATSFRAGDEFAVRGSGFPANALVLVALRQAVGSPELGRFRTDAVGDFTTEPTVLRVPAGAPSGGAVVRVSSGAGSAECAIQVSAAAATPASRPDPEPVEEAGNSWFLAWGLLLVLGAAALAYGSYRRWQARRLEEAISSSKPGPRPKAASRRGRRVPPPPRLDPSGLPPSDDQPARLNGPTSPPILPPGWDRGMEPIPATPPANGKKVVDW